MAIAKTRLYNETYPLKFYQSVTSLDKLRNASNLAEILVKDYQVGSDMRLDVFRAKMVLLAVLDIYQTALWYREAQQFAIRSKDAEGDKGFLCWYYLDPVPRVTPSFFFFFILHRNQKIIPRYGTTSGRICL